MIDINLMDAVEQASGSNEKLDLLRKQPDSAREFLRWAVDPTITFGVTVDVESALKVRRLDNAGPAGTEEQWWKMLYDALDRMSKRIVTGGNAQLLFALIVKGAPTERHVVWACRCLMKDLRCGIGVSTVNKVWKEPVVDDLSVMLAQPYDPEKHSFDGWWALEPKLDGYRMTIIDGVAYSRNKRVFTSVDHILKEFTDSELADNVLDGEIMGGAKDFDEAGGSIRRKSEQAAGAVYHVFDLVKRSQWGGPTDQLGSAGGRRWQLEEFLSRCPLGYRRNVQAVRHMPMKDATHEQAIQFMRTFIKEGYEGAIAKRLSVSYVYDRGPDVIKLKDFVSADLRVTGRTEGRGKHKGKLGALYVELNGVQSKVGSGFTDAERTEIWKMGDAVVGRIAECQYQNLSKDGCLRFPVFLRFRPDRE